VLLGMSCAHDGGLRRIIDVLRDNRQALPKDGQQRIDHFIHYALYHLSLQAPGWQAGDIPNIDIAEVRHKANMLFSNCPSP